MYMHVSPTSPTPSLSLPLTHPLIKNTRLQDHVARLQQTTAATTLGGGREEEEGGQEDEEEEEAVCMRVGVGVGVGVCMYACEVDRRGGVHACMHHTS